MGISTGGAAVSVLPYPELRQRHLAELRARLPEHVKRLAWSREHIEEERRLRFRQLLRTARDRSAFHRRRLAGADLDRFEVADLASIPVMTKQDVMQRFDEIVTDPRLTLDLVERHLASLSDGPRYLLGEYQGIASGGSTGVRGVYPYGWDAWLTCYLGWIRYAVRMLGVGPLRAAVVAAGKPIHVSFALSYSFSDPEGISYRPFPVTSPIDEIVAGLNQYRPDILGAYPSAMPPLVAAAREGRLRIAPRLIVTGGEPLLPETRAALAETWGAPVANWWLCSEGGPMGVGCGVGEGMHLAEDLVIVEPVDDERRPVPPGVRSAGVLLTNLYNPAFPLIRYEITDEITLLGESCPCGSPHGRVGDVQGRLDETFRYGRVSVHPQLFRSVLGAERAITEYQVYQSPRGADVKLLGAGIDTAAIACRLSAELARLGVPSPEVSVTMVERLVRMDTGKLVRFVALPAGERAPRPVDGGAHEEASHGA